MHSDLGRDVIRGEQKPPGLIKRDVGRVVAARNLREQGQLSGRRLNAKAGQFPRGAHGDKEQAPSGITGQVAWFTLGLCVDQVCEFAALFIESI
jgi:hypothetical protein